MWYILITNLGIVQLENALRGEDLGAAGGTGPSGQGVREPNPNPNLRDRGGQAR